MLAAGLVLAACDLNPFVIDRQRSVGPVDAGRPIETVTALEIDTGTPDQQP